MLTDEMKENLIYWIGSGLEYRIIHKMMKRKFCYDVTRRELQDIINLLAVRNAAKLFNKKDL